MATKDFSKITEAKKEMQAAVMVQATTPAKRPQGRPRKLPQGAKPYLIRLSLDNIKYVEALAGYYSVGHSELLNKILDKHRKDNEALYKKALKEGETKADSLERL